MSYKIWDCPLLDSNPIQDEIPSRPLEQSSPVSARNLRTEPSTGKPFLCMSLYALQYSRQIISNTVSSQKFDTKTNSSVILPHARPSGYFGRAFKMLETHIKTARNVLARFLLDCFDAIDTNDNANPISNYRPRPYYRYLETNIL